MEIINGVGGRRRWSADDKARMVEESLVPGAVISEVARRHGLTPQQLFAWRREARRHRDAEPLTQGFVPAVVEVSAVPPGDIPPVHPNRFDGNVRDRPRSQRSSLRSTA